MFKHIARKLAVCSTILLAVTPAALASPLGTDPEPKLVTTLLSLLGLG